MAQRIGERMFEYLTKIDERLYERYLTVERNIKSGSNSFYDSFLDMQEQFIKIVAINENIDVPATATCGQLLHIYATIKVLDFRVFIKKLRH